MARQRAASVAGWPSHPRLDRKRRKAWIPGASPGMTAERMKPRPKPCFQPHFPPVFLDSPLPRSIKHHPAQVFPRADCFCTIGGNDLQRAEISRSPLGFPWGWPRWTLNDWTRSRPGIPRPGSNTKEY